MPTPRQQRRRALELLEASIDGCTEAIMLAYGFKTAPGRAGQRRARDGEHRAHGRQGAPDPSHPHADYRGWPAGAH